MLICSFTNACWDAQQLLQLIYKLEWCYYFSNSSVSCHFCFSYHCTEVWVIWGRHKFVVLTFKPGKPNKWCSLIHQTFPTNSSKELVCSLNFKFWKLLVCLSPEAFNVKRMSEHNIYGYIYLSCLPLALWIQIDTYGFGFLIKGK